MKILLIVIPALVFVFSMSGCSGSGNVEWCIDQMEESQNDVAIAVQNSDPVAFLKAIEKAADIMVYMSKHNQELTEDWDNLSTDEQLMLSVKMQKMAKNDPTRHATDATIMIAIMSNPVSKKKFEDLQEKMFALERPSFGDR